MIFRTFCPQFGDLVDVHCRTLSKSTDLTFSPRGKMVVLCYVLSGWFHIYEKLKSASLCPYLQSTGLQEVVLFLMIDDSFVWFE